MKQERLTVDGSQTTEKRARKATGYQGCRLSGVWLQMYSCLHPKVYRVEHYPGPSERILLITNHSRSGIAHTMPISTSHYLVPQSQRLSEVRLRRHRY